MEPFINHVQSPLATSYFNDAADLIHQPVPMRNFLGTYPSRMPHFHYHTRNKAPLAILYYYVILRMFPNPDTAALIGACCSAHWGLAIPTTWYMIKVLIADDRAAPEGITYFALIPALLILLPEFDLLYIPLTALLIAFWSRAIETGKVRYAILAALSITITCLFAFNTLVIGTVLIAITLVQRPKPRLVLRQLLIATATTIGFYLLLYAIWRYNPIATLLEAWHNQNINLKPLHRPWPNTIPTDLTNFFISLGWLPLLVLLTYFVQKDRPHLALVVICLAEPVLVALTGLLQSESHRLWLFLTPLVVLPLGLELARWPRHHRVALFACQTLILAFLTESMRFH